MARHELTGTQFVLLEPVLPTNDRRGRPSVDHRKVLNGLFWKLNTGAQRRDIPERSGPRPTIDDRYLFWRRDGASEQMHVAGTSIRAGRSATGARQKGASLLMTQPTAPVGDPVAATARIHVVVTVEQAHESSACEAVAGSMRVHRAGKRPRRRAARWAGDRAGDAARIRTWLRRHGMQSVIAERRRVTPGRCG
jgi:transposase